MIKDVLRLVLHPNADMDAIARYMTCVDGRDRFLRGEISFSDYCDILKAAGVDLDDYFDDVTWNFAARGINV